MQSHVGEATWAPESQCGGEQPTNQEHLFQTLCDQEINFYHV